MSPAQEIHYPIVHRLSSSNVMDFSYKDTQCDLVFLQQDEKKRTEVL